MVIHTNRIATMTAPVANSAAAPALQTINLGVPQQWDACLLSRLLIPGHAVLVLSEMSKLGHRLPQLFDVVHITDGYTVQQLKTVPLANGALQNFNQLTTARSRQTKRKTAPAQQFGNHTKVLSPTKVSKQDSTAVAVHASGASRHANTNKDLHGNLRRGGYQSGSQSSARSMHVTLLDTGSSQHVSNFTTEFVSSDPDSVTAAVSVSLQCSYLMTILLYSLYNFVVFRHSFILSATRLLRIFRLIIESTRKCSTSELKRMMIRHFVTTN